MQESQSTAINVNLHTHIDEGLQAESATPYSSDAYVGSVDVENTILCERKNSLFQVRIETTTSAELALSLDTLFALGLVLASLCVCRVLLTFDWHKVVLHFRFLYLR